MTTPADEAREAEHRLVPTVSTTAAPGGVLYVGGGGSYASTYAQCDDTTDHGPHQWNDVDKLKYGPADCPGYPPPQWQAVPMGDLLHDGYHERTET